MVSELLIWDFEPLPQAPDLGCISEGRLQDRLEVVVVGMDDAISRHGNQTPTEWVDADTVDVMLEALFGSHLAATVVAHGSRFNLAETVGLAEVVDHH